ncbi:sensor histidine kinase [Myceligenerans pegani]|uniref:histidine kinase n=1 Tax=Myceligenerans pegani TaxID=2776917 RepID=A0ABR9MUG2_9MICO|nr:HAMP domain-containing sensor histidine kinase [Myceligenerans sp. TRM 65318]MBE1875014.1 HAMP domain-containing histidine kinase [Myceligenerans sp. TRM 65318]MBE3017285.1 HAMP domain-containing histidine kinase [Myceligenerans sp. TRM 65318]
MSGARRLSIHVRIWAGFALVLVVSGGLIVAAVYLGMRYLPSYDLGAIQIVAAEHVEDAPTVAPVSPSPASSPSPYARAATVLVRSKEDVWATVLTVSLTGAALVGALGLAAGWLLTRRLLAPLGDISRAAARAGEGDLAYRIGADGPDDELRQLADTFDLTLARLERSFEAHRRFAANASHELLTPLAATRTALQVAGDDDAELGRIAPRLRAANERSIEIVHGLLQLANAEHAELDAAPVDLAALAGEACAEAREEAAAAGLRMTAALEAGSLVAGSSVLLRQLLANLVGNAVRHNTAGGRVRVAVDGDVAGGRTGTADRGAAPGGGTVTLEVANTGPLLDAAEVDRLFEPFHRADSRVRSDRSGHGLGLAIARAVVVAHHGTITATARPEGGLVVRVTLPGAGVPERPGQG